MLRSSSSSSTGGGAGAAEGAGVGAVEGAGVAARVAGLLPYVSTPDLTSDGAATAALGLGAGPLSVACFPFVHVGIAMNWSNSRTGLLTSLQHAGVRGGI